MNTKIKLNNLFYKYVPSQGKCETLGGEIIRAFAKMNYRWYNDGDKFWEGYGVETCGSSAIFLANNGFQSHLDSMIDVNDKIYATKLKELMKLILDYVTKNPEVFTTKNNVDSVCDFYREAKKNWYVPEYDDYDDDYDVDWDY